MEANAVVLVYSLAAILAVCLLISRLVWDLVWKPYTGARWFARQGIRGPPYRFLVGSLWEVKRMLAAGRAKAAPESDPGCHQTALLNPFFQKCVSNYGKTFLYSLGPVPVLCSTDMEIVQQVLGDRSDLFQKDYMNPSLEGIFGKGVIFVNGDDWKRHRKVVYPLFSHDNLKSVSAMTSQDTQKMIQRCCTQIENDDKAHQAEIDIKCESQELTTGVIERVILGNKSKKAREAFVVGKELQKLSAYAFTDPPVPGFRYIPTRRNCRTWKLVKFMKSKVMQIIKERLHSHVSGDDLLGLMLQACRRDVGVLSTEEIISECVTIFAAGQDTTCNIITWGMFLFSIYPHWQEKVRVEVLRELPDEDELHMFILETLRLYSPVPFLLRKIVADTMLANIKVPKGTMIMFPVAVLHRDLELWGLDANEFNPMRFEKRVLRSAKHPHVLLAFSHGPRACAGKSYAMIQVQTVMTMILRKFSFTLSSKYVHMHAHELPYTDA